MSIKTDFDKLWDEKKEKDGTVEAKALLQNAMWVIEETNSRVQVIIDAGTLDKAPKTVGDALKKSHTVVKTASTGFSDPDVKEVLGWAGN